MQTSGEPRPRTIKAKWVAMGSIVITVVVVAGFVGAFAFMYKTSSEAINVGLFSVVHLFNIAIFVPD